MAASTHGTTPTAGNPLASGSILHVSDEMLLGMTSLCSGLPAKGRVRSYPNGKKTRALVLSVYAGDTLCLGLYVHARSWPLGKPIYVKCRLRKWITPSLEDETSDSWSKRMNREHMLPKAREALDFTTRLLTTPSNQIVDVTFFESKMPKGAGPLSLVDVSIGGLDVGRILLDNRLALPLVECDPDPWGAYYDIENVRWDAALRIAEGKARDWAEAGIADRPAAVQH